jgi:hypothetical protein
VLFTDLYEVTMAASYLREAMHELATFSLVGNDHGPFGAPRRSSTRHNWWRGRVVPGLDCGRVDCEEEGVP